MLAHLKAGPHSIFCHFPTNSIFFLCFRWKSVFLAIGSCQSKLVYTQKLVSSLRGISNFDSNYIIHTLFQQYCVCDVWQVSDAPKPRRSALITQYCCFPQVVNKLLWVNCHSQKNTCATCFLLKRQNKNVTSFQVCKHLKASRNTQQSNVYLNYLWNFCSWIQKLYLYLLQSSIFFQFVEKKNYRKTK